MHYAFCATGIHVVRVWSITANELLRGVNQISYRNGSFCFRCHLPSDTYCPIMKEIIALQFVRFNIVYSFRK